MARLWDKGLPLDERVLRYTAGEDHRLDARLVPYDVRGSIDPARHRVISTVSGVSLAQLRDLLRSRVPIVRAMPNTAVAVRESMTCLCAAEDAAAALAEAVVLFEGVGRTLVIREELMIPANALCACGIAFFLRSIRAACSSCS